MDILRDKVAVVTGASSGIGRETALLLAASGCKVAVLARNGARLAEVAAAIDQAGAGSLPVPADVTDEDSVRRAFERVTDALGPVDLLVNSAGIGFATDLSRLPLAEYRRIFETNVTGVFLCCRAVLPAMRARRSGHIVNVSSAAGKAANPNAPLYCASKHALNGYSSGLQQQVAADRVRVSLVSPSAVDTAYWDGREVDRTKFLRAREVAEVIHFIVTRPEGVLIKDVDLGAQR